MEDDATKTIECLQTGVPFDSTQSDSIHSGTRCNAFLSLAFLFAQPSSHHVACSSYNLVSFAAVAAVTNYSWSAPANQLHELLEKRFDEVTLKPRRTISNSDQLEARARLRITAGLWPFL